MSEFNWLWIGSNSRLLQTWQCNLDLTGGFLASLATMNISINTLHHGVRVTTALNKVTSSDEEIKQYLITH
jgi:hypothetical protein